MASFCQDAVARQQLNLEQLCGHLRQKYPDTYAASQNELHDQRLEKERQKVITVLKQLVRNLIAGFRSGTGCELKFTRRNHWPNVQFDPDAGLSIVPQPICTVSSGEKLHRIARIIMLLLRNLDIGERAQKRDVAYMGQLQHFQSQMDDVIDDIAVTCGISRISLNITSSAKGIIFGDLEYTNRSGEVLMCSSSGTVTMTVPNVSTDIRSMSSPASFILVVEKETVFTRLLQQNFPAEQNCILVTGKGYPDLPTRRMVKQLWNFLRIPVLALVDGDPHGIEIMCVYRFGSLGLAYDSQSLACPQIRWLGFFPSDFPHHCQYLSKTELSASDRQKLRDLMTRPYIADSRMSDLKAELIDLGAGNCKYGLESFANLRSDYLSRNFLPQCLSRGRFI